MAAVNELNGPSNETPTQSRKISPTDRTSSPPDINLPDELWMTVLDSPCTFPPDIYHGVMLNMITNPNITSSHLFRADIFFDTGVHDDSLDSGHDQPNKMLKHIKADYRPIDYELPGYTRTRTMVRQLVPRNPQLDRPLLQTCHFFQRLEEDEETHVVLYIPHVQQAEEMPFYHPTVSKLAFTHKWRIGPPPTETPSDTTPSHLGSVSISYSLFPSPSTTSPPSLTPKLSRTALRLLSTLHKHGQGQQAGYQKRVHLDRIIPQTRYQDTYTRLKTKYGRKLAEQWVEVTDPGKHVFEDLGIAAFLVEVWRDMYALPGADGKEGGGGEGGAVFPGFVDIGCGNGVLTYILLSEGYRGWGFDARKRKTWSIFPPKIQEHLNERLLVPEIFQSGKRAQEMSDDSTWHDGIFRDAPGSFIISNHADELTAWTPLLAYLNNASFIAIPCCSHDLAGSRFRAPLSTKAGKTRYRNDPSISDKTPRRLPQQQQQHQDPTQKPTNPNPDLAVKPTTQQAVESGSLARTPSQQHKKLPSAYATLCSYVRSLAQDVGFEVEEEVLRIPSTRNLCVIGRRRRRRGSGTAGGEADADADEGEGDDEDVLARRERVVGIVEVEMGRGVEVVGGEWIARAEGLGRKPGSGH
ncbi:tRNA(Ser) Um(44) 2'-O-methyltransferase [Friedmanniomyces endolithicus]|uniref:tRNA (uracil-O(2)-)-methyltransferase n=1 Tax=Friedmanniomyces endolithicus TaxID=329885 RepID=A0AAN6K352_9PEZI|nr:tRNA(Ser) Um(44) 2'-O-methyltransferase [Friedmanniomyces endolithicus]KAK0776367.1 tRNA(Ser) Um(44) 2'-O-methyltransferase [Friedmanniomyces endolithicus]KAK0802777.1 tRNA(Ser) Um(44) 2'-O-methyltransferase [Friedmanniomyces endolithicus]KAK0890714.1 tRNA(Ser) Um(44) 2'-O-methyltransferase [Friedmanniomyces endolithicus]KAK0925631.1 tRNA(Ser) Um(44) 2'-O-methyltransferase [Friedmanniomyces endolithicus]